jgi:hypothetical protein
LPLSRALAKSDHLVTAALQVMQATGFLLLLASLRLISLRCSAAYQRVQRNKRTGLPYGRATFGATKKDFDHLATSRVNVGLNAEFGSIGR